MRKVPAVFALTLLLLPSAPASADTLDGSSPKERRRTLRALGARVERRIAEVKDYTCTFTKHERTDGELRPVETMLLKHRGPGVCLYMKWTSGHSRGREVIYCEGRYGDKIQTHEGSGIASWVSLSLDPLGSRAMRGNRHSIIESGIFNAVRFLSELSEARKGDVERVGPERVHGQPSICAWIARPSGKRTEVCIHQELLLPTRIRREDSAGELLEEYTYRDFKVNVGLTDRDFDVENDDYDF